MKLLQLSSLALSFGLCGLAAAGQDPSEPIHGTLEDVGAGLFFADAPPPEFNYAAVLIHEREAISGSAIHSTSVYVNIDFLNDPYTFVVVGNLPDRVVDVSWDGPYLVAHAKWDFHDAFDVLIRKCDHAGNCFPSDVSELPDSTVNGTWYLTPQDPSGTVHLLRQDSQGKYEVFLDSNTGIAGAEATVLGHHVFGNEGTSLSHVKGAVTYPPGFRYPLPPSPQFFCVKEVCDGLYPPN